MTGRGFHVAQARAAVRWAACVLAIAVGVAVAEQTYVVRRGDTLYGIARNHGITPSRLAARNGLSKNHYVRRGERLVIPDQTSPATPPLPALVQRAIGRVEVKPGRWKHIVIHHSGVDTGTIKGMDRYHREERHMQNGLALHSRLGELIEHIQAMTEVPVAVLTNGSLLWQKQVREELALADLVMPSLDAPDRDRFDFINRPHPEVTFAVRPPAEHYAIAVNPERLAEFATRFNPPAEVIAEYRGRRKSAEPQASVQAVLSLLQRRPCTLLDVVHGLHLKPNEAIKLLDALEAEGRVCGSRHGESYFYQRSGETEAGPRGDSGLGGLAPLT